MKRMKLKAGSEYHDVDVMFQVATEMRVRMPWTDGSSRMIQGHYFRGSGDSLTFTLRQSGRWIPTGDPDDGHRQLELLTEEEYMKRVGKGIYVLEEDPGKPDDRHGKDLRKQYEDHKKDKARHFFSTNGTLLVDVDSGNPQDHIPCGESGCIVPAMVEMHTIRDMHGEHLRPRPSNTGAIPGVKDKKKAKYGTKGVTRRELDAELKPVKVEEDFYP